MNNTRRLDFQSDFNLILQLPFQFYKKVLKNVQEIDILRNIPFRLFHNYVEGNFLHAREKRIKVDWKWMYVINSSLEDRA